MDEGQEGKEVEQKIRAWVLERTEEAWSQARNRITAVQLQRVHRIGFNTACRVLEGLENDGQLVRVSAADAVWTRAPKAPRITSNDALPLSPEERGALMRLLDGISAPHLPGPAVLADTLKPGDLTALRAIRLRLEKGEKG